MEGGFSKFIQLLLSRADPDPAGELSEEERDAVLGGDVSLEGVARGLSTGRFRRIVVMTGAGISISAGIPDFRSPGSGLFAVLAEFGLDRPEALFDIAYFRENPKPFFRLAQRLNLRPGAFRATPTHHFIRLLHDKGLLLRNYTQNVDCLERLAGLPEEALVDAHGNFATSHCTSCRAPADSSEVWRATEVGEVPRCAHCGQTVKPDIVFYGEALPPRFGQLCGEDMEEADLLIVIGTSLAVQPFASLVGMAKPTAARLLINREATGTTLSNGFRFHADGNYRDVLALGDCDDVVQQLVELAGWEEEFAALQAAASETHAAAMEALGFAAPVAGAHETAGRDEAVRTAHEVAEAVVEEMAAGGEQGERREREAEA